MKAGEQEVSKPIDVVATVRNFSPRFYPGGPWSLSVSLGSTPNLDNELDIKYGLPFCIDGAKCALGATGDICGGRVHETVVHELGLN